MAAAASVSTVGAGAVQEGVEKVPISDPGTKTLTCRRFVQHYVDNNNASNLPTARLVDTTQVVYEQGYYHIPFTSVIASTTVANEDILRQSKRYRIKAGGFKIHKCQAIQQTVGVTAGATQITNSFIQAPYVLIYKDTEHELFENTYAAGVTVPSIPIWQLNAPNSLARTYQTSYAGGALSLTGFCQRGSNAGGLLQPSDFDLLNGGEVVMVGSGSNYEYSWESPIKNWLSPGAIQGAATPASGTDFQQQPDLINYWGNLNENMATEVTQLYQPPCMHLLRVPPSFDTLGAILVGFDMMIEYWTEWEYDYGRYWFNRLLVAQPTMAAWYTNRRTVNKNFNDITGVVDPEIAETSKGLKTAARQRYKNM